MGSFDADEMAPLALMIRPPSSSPPSFQRARSGAGVLSGFQAFAVGSHHFVGALDFQPRIAATIPLAEPVAVVRPQLAGRRIGRPSSSARRRCARPCWRAPRIRRFAAGALSGSFDRPAVGQAMISFTGASSSPSSRPGCACPLSLRDRTGHCAVPAKNSAFRYVAKTSRQNPDSCSIVSTR